MAYAERAAVDPSVIDHRYPTLGSRLDLALQMVINRACGEGGLWPDLFESLRMLASTRHLGRFR